MTNLPSGVSPLFPVLFLAGSGCVRLRPARAAGHATALVLALDAVLGGSRVTRGAGPRRSSVHSPGSGGHRSIDQRACDSPSSGSTRSCVSLWSSCHRLLLHPLVLPRQARGRFEGSSFDVCLFITFVVAAWMINSLRALKLLVIWTKTRSMLQLTLEYLRPMAQAFASASPPAARGAGSSGTRRTSGSPQAARAPPERRPEGPQHGGIGDNLQDDLPDRRAGHWDRALVELRDSLADKEGTLDSTPAVSSVPGPDLGRPSRRANPPGNRDPSRTSRGTGPPVEVGLRLRYLALDAQGSPEAHLRRHMVRSCADWGQDGRGLGGPNPARPLVRTGASPAAPADHEVPGDRFTFPPAGALTSYPFDHQGWMMTVMVVILLFVAGIPGGGALSA